MPMPRKAVTLPLSDSGPVLHPERQVPVLKTDEISGPQPIVLMKLVPVNNRKDRQ